MPRQVICRGIAYFVVVVCSNMSAVSVVQAKPQIEKSGYVGSAGTIGFDEAMDVTSETIDAKSAEQFGDISSVEAIRSTPGVQVRTAGSLGEEATLRIRGTSEDQNLVLLDRVPLNSSFNSAFDFGSFLLTGFDSIRLQKGGRSSYYGSSAMGGALLFDSQRGLGDFQIDAAVQGGNLGLLSESVPYMKKISCLVTMRIINVPTCLLVMVVETTIKIIRRRYVLIHSPQINYLFHWFPVFIMPISNFLSMRRLPTFHR